MLKPKMAVNMPHIAMISCKTDDFLFDIYTSMFYSAKRNIFAVIIYHHFPVVTITCQLGLDRELVLGNEGDIVK
jgi:hypothetical protein